MLLFTATNSNTTLVKVKLMHDIEMEIRDQNSNTTLVKVKLNIQDIYK